MNGDKPQLPPDQDQAAGQWQFKPEDKTAPQAVQAAPAPQPAQATVPVSDVPVAAPVANSVPTPAVASAPVTDMGEPALPEPVASDLEVSWTASEYIAHNKGISWYALLAAAIAVISVAAYLMTHDFISTAIIVIIAAAVGVSASRKPRVLPYHVGPQGLTISNKFYPYGQFKSFSIMDEGAFSSIMFLPMQRLMPPLSIYYDPEDEERIVAALSMYLPMEMRKHDVMDNLARRFRF